MKKARGGQGLASLLRIALFSAVIAVCALISIPSPVPFTLQTFGVFLAVLMLGGRDGSLAVLLYILLGAVGLPVFSGFTGGMGALFGTGGGYILGFLAAACVLWLGEALLGKGAVARILASVSALLLLYTVGTLWFVAVYTKTHTVNGLLSVLLLCVIPYVIPDALKITLAFLVTKRLTRTIKQS